MKAEILNALRNLNIDDNGLYDFDENQASYSFEEQLKVDNIWVDVQFTIYVEQIDVDELIYVDIDLESVQIWDNFSNLINYNYRYRLSDDEIADAILQSFKG